MNVRDTVARFDSHLAKRGLRLEAVVVGGAALCLLGVVSRPTRDCDVMQPELAEEIVEAARAFAEASRTAGLALEDDWLNNGPATLARHLPSGWQERVQEVYRGRALVLRTLGRGELLLTKLFAYCDRAQDLEDCIALAPTAVELRAALPWLREQDASPLWPGHVDEAVRELAFRLGHGVHETT